MSLVRAFIAIEIPPPIQFGIDQQTVGLRDAADSRLVRWVQPSNLHLTLKFLGDISLTSVQFLAQMLTAAAAQHEAFEVQIGTLGCFPSSKRARVIWIGIQAPPALETLRRGIEAGTRRLGYPAEARGFSPHLTIGRVKERLSATESQRVQNALDSHHVGVIGNAEVNSVHLIKADLQPTGSIYTRLFSAPLGTTSTRGEP